MKALPIVIGVTAVLLVGGGVAFAMTGDKKKAALPGKPGQPSLPGQPGQPSQPGQPAQPGTPAAPPMPPPNPVSPNVPPVAPAQPPAPNLPPNAPPQSRFITAPSGLKMRSGPGTQFPEVGSAAPFKATVTLLSESTTATPDAPLGWGQIQWQGRTGWSSREWLSNASPAAGPTPGVPQSTGNRTITSSPDGANLRSAPTTASSILTAIPFGARVNATDGAGPPDAAAPMGWSSVEWAGKHGFVSTKLISPGAIAPRPDAPTAGSPEEAALQNLLHGNATSGPTPAAAPTARVTSSNGVNLRAQPNASATKLGAAPQGATLTMLNANSGPPDSAAPQGWAQISWSGITAHVTKAGIA